MAQKTLTPRAVSGLDGAAICAKPKLTHIRVDTRPAEGYYDNVIAGGVPDQAPAIPRRAAICADARPRLHNISSVGRQFTSFESRTS